MSTKCWEVQFQTVALTSQFAGKQPLTRRPGRCSFDASPHRSTNSINASLGNAERRPPAKRAAGQAHAGGRRARDANSLTLAKIRTAGYRGLTATPDHLSFPTVWASQDVLRCSR